MNKKISALETSSVVCKNQFSNFVDRIVEFTCEHLCKNIFRFRERQLLRSWLRLFHWMRLGIRSTIPPPPRLAPPNHHHHFFTPTLLKTKCLSWAYKKKEVMICTCMSFILPCICVCSVNAVLAHFPSQLLYFLRYSKYHA